MQVGEVMTFERTFTRDDVKIFTGVSKDEGVHHITPNEQGEFVVQGLLTATLPTKIGGDLDVLAQKMNVEFLCPVFSGDTIRCNVMIERFEPIEGGRVAISTSFLCKNQHDKDVMKGLFSGVILNDVQNV